MMYDNFMVYNIYFKSARFIKKDGKDLNDLNDVKDMKDSSRPSVV